MRTDGVLESAYWPYVCLCAVGWIGAVDALSRMGGKVGDEYYRCGAYGGG
ncbi:MAG: hypothetical protein UY06_C0004G0001 [Candidatus Amesbacteria bacterium GW2011_GWA2_47_70]|nr:MAG: hypothetical protein UY06_C0004G0001 [Candidatus Amesbacteria bacterium GW2011_GWA2_47_70]